MIRGMKMAWADRFMDNPLWNSVYDRFLWQDVFPLILPQLRAVIVVRDPVQCFYSLHHTYYGRSRPPDSRNFQDLRICIRDALTRFRNFSGNRTAIDDEVIYTGREDDSEEVCAIMLNWCASSHNLEQGCRLSPGMCDRDRLRIVRVENFGSDELAALAHWVSRGNARHVHSNECGSSCSANVARYREKMGNAKWPKHLISEDEHDMMVASYADEYGALPIWLDNFGL